MMKARTLNVSTLPSALPAILNIYSSNGLAWL